MKKLACIIDYNKNKGHTTIAGRASEIKHCVVDALKELGESSIGAVIVEELGGTNYVHIYSDSKSSIKSVDWNWKEWPGRPSENQKNIKKLFDDLGYNGQRGYVAHGAKIVASVGSQHNTTVVFYISQRLGA